MLLVLVDDVLPDSVADVSSSSPQATTVATIRPRLRISAVFMSPTMTAAA